MLLHERVNQVLNHDSNQSLIDADLIDEYANASLGCRGDMVQELSAKALANAGAILSSPLDPIKPIITLLVSYKMERERLAE